jgi:hypothetical protein
LGRSWSVCRSRNGVLCNLFPLLRFSVSFSARQLRAALQQTRSRVSPNTNIAGKELTTQLQVKLHFMAITVSVRLCFMPFLITIKLETIYLDTYRRSPLFRLHLCTDLHSSRQQNKKANLSLQQSVEAHEVLSRRGSHIFYTIASDMAVKLSALRAGRPLPPGIFLVLISVRG